MKKDEIIGHFEAGQKVELQAFGKNITGTVFQLQGDCIVLEDVSGIGDKIMPKVKAAYDSITEIRLVGSHAQEAAALLEAAPAVDIASRAQEAEGGNVEEFVHNDWEIQMHSRSPKTAAQPQDPNGFFDNLSRNKPKKTQRQGTERKPSHE